MLRKQRILFHTNVGVKIDCVLFSNYRCGENPINVGTYEFDSK